jgi:hypothetical protein
VEEQGDFSQSWIDALFSIVWPPVEVAAVVEMIRVSSDERD